MNRGLTFVLLLTSSSWSMGGQVAQRANEEYRTPESRQKAAAEMDHPIRASVEHSADLVRSIEIAPGSMVADVGTGVGYLIPYLLTAVGRHGSIVAQDIYPDFVARVNEKIQTRNWKNVRAVLGTAKDPKLPIGVLDIALVLDVYHHLDYPADILSQLRRALKPGGRLVVVDYYRSRKHPGATDVDLTTHIRADRDGVIDEVRAQGFRLTRHFDHLPHEYVLIFSR